MSGLKREITRRVAFAATGSAVSRGCIGTNLDRLNNAAIFLSIDKLSRDR